MKAKTLAQVIAAEAGGKTRAQRLTDMKNIYSSMVNRAKATGVAVKDVFSVESQYNAYNSKMPPGTAALVGLANEAIAAVHANGVTHAGLYYATPAAVNNLPAGLVEIPGIGGVHKAFYDPKNRAVITKAGAKAVNQTALAESLPATMELPGSARPGTAIPAGLSRPGPPSISAPLSMPSAERFGYGPPSAERFGYTLDPVAAANRAIASMPGANVPMEGDIPSQAPGVPRDGVYRDMIDTAQWTSAGFAPPALANAAIGRALTPTLSVPRTPTGGVYRDMIDTAQWSPAGFARPELANAAIGRALASSVAPFSQQSIDAARREQTPRSPNVPSPALSAPSPGSVRGLAAVGNSLPPDRAMPSGSVSKPAMASRERFGYAPPSNFAKGPTSLPPDRAMPSGPISSPMTMASTERFGGTTATTKSAPTLGYSGKTAAEIAAIGNQVRANPAAPSTATYAAMRPTAAHMAGVVASAPLGYAPTTANAATPFSSVPSSLPTNPSQLGGITMSNPKGLIDLTAEFARPAFNVTAPPPALAPPTVPTVLTPPVPTHVNHPPNPTVGLPPATAYDVYSGVADTAKDRMGNTISSMPGGTSVTNQYGKTTGMVNGYQTAVGSMPSLPGISGPTANKVGGLIGKYGVPAAIGAVAGGIPGVIAGLLGAAAKEAFAPGGLLAPKAPTPSLAAPSGRASVSSGQSSGSRAGAQNGTRPGGGGYQTSAGAQSNSKSQRY